MTPEQRRQSSDAIRRGGNLAMGVATFVRAFAALVEVRLLPLTRDAGEAEARTVADGSLRETWGTNQFSKYLAVWNAGRKMRSRPM